MQSPEAEKIEQQLDAVCLEVKLGFQDMRKDVGYLGRIYLPMVVVVLISLVISIVGLATATDNRNMILRVQSETTRNTRDLENITPIIMQPYGPSPDDPPTSGGK